MFYDIRLALLRPLVTRKKFQVYITQIFCIKDHYLKIIHLIDISRKCFHHCVDFRKLLCYIGQRYTSSIELFFPFPVDIIGNMGLLMLILINISKI